MAKNSELKTASVLAFERKLDPSDAVFYAGNWADKDTATAWSALSIREKTIRGTISNRLKKVLKDDPAKLDAEVIKPNIQTVDVATLPNHADTLKVTFTLRILANLSQPCVCNSLTYQQKFIEIVEGYIANQGLTTLAERYAYNLASGRFLWRNRLSAEQIEIRISYQPQGQVEPKTVSFNAFDFSMNHFECSAADQAKLNEITQVIAAALSGKQPYALLDIVAFAKMGKGQEVFPSQELALDKGKKSKTLYQINDIAAMHSQKIGNAIRTIDTWYEEGQTVAPISVEPYGSVTSQGKAYRPPVSKKDFYTLLDNWIIKDKAPDLVQQHYVIAGLIRGGVFGESGKE